VDSFAYQYANRLGDWSDIRDWMPTLYEAAHGADVLELGVRTGNSTVALLAGVEAGGGHVTSVDIDMARVPGGWFESPLWTFVHADSRADLYRDVDPEANFDLVFIDTSHHYQATWCELVRWGARVPDGGRIMLHDTELGRPYDAPETDPDFPVAVAATEYADLHGWAIDLLPGCSGLGVIHVKR
jgi:predicted O-methyltransferase YrrM